MLNGRAPMGTPTGLSMLNCLLGWVALAREEVNDAGSRTVPARLLAGAPIALEVAVFDRQGGLVASTGFRPVAD